MKMKNNKGITLIALAITVIVLAIIATTTVTVGSKIIESAKLENIETYLLLIQSKSKMLSDSIAIGEKTESDLKGTKQTSGEYSGWYKLSQSDLDEMGVERANANDGYYVDYTNEDVAYEKGVSADNQTFYKLSEIEEYRQNQ